MDIISIFDQNLFAFKYPDEELDEFHRLFSLWNDPEYLEEFFEANIEDITDGFYGTFTVEGAIILPLNASKARQDWLRLYALRVDKHIYIITGGAIKLTRTMQERDHTKEELAKIKMCREYLINKGISDIDGVIEEMEIL